MGKASRKLKANLKSSEDSNDNSNVEEQENPQISNEELYDENTYKAALLIYAKLNKYSQDESYPLCESLDTKNIENYLRWIMAYYR